MEQSRDVLADGVGDSTDSPRQWLWALLVGLAVCLVYVIVPEEWIAFRQIVLAPSTALAAAACVLVGVRRYRPIAPSAWLWIGGGLLALGFGDLLWGVYEWRGDDPFPGAADVFFLASYPLFAIALARATSRRRPFGVDARAAIDAAILTVIGGFLGWVYVARPIINDDVLSPFESVVLILYPAGDLLLFAVAMRFVMGSSWGNRALRMLVLGFSLTLAGDVMFALGTVGNVQADRWWDAVLLFAIVVMGAASLDPSMRALTEESGDPAVWNDVWRLPVVFGACLIPPIVLLVRERTGREETVVATVLAMVLVIALASARFLFMTKQTRLAAEREAALSHYTADLLAAADRAHLFDAARAAISAVGVGASEASILLGSEQDLASVAADFSAPIVLRGAHVGALIADGDPEQLRRWRPALTTIAAELSIALERDELLASERAAAESLAEQNERLREIDAMKDRFVSSVSHELRTPLTSMVGYLEILSAGEVGELNAEQSHFVEIINRNCHRLNVLINDILLAARFDSGRMPLDRADVDLAELTSERLESIHATAAGNGVEVRLVGEPDHVVVDGDRMRLGQLIDNLLSNAVKFTPSGGSVSLSIAEEAGTGVVEVRDTGVGMPAEDLDKIFDRFYRASTATHVAGTGLGLSIAQSIAEAHGGTIGVTSELGVGTTFRVELPLERSMRASAPTDGHEVTA